MLTPDEGKKKKKKKKWKKKTEKKDREFLKNFIAPKKEKTVRTCPGGK